jgi:hypothetical protein
LSRTQNFAKRWRNWRQETKQKWRSSSPGSTACIQARILKYILHKDDFKFCKALEKLEAGDKTKIEIILTRINRVYSGGNFKNIF